MTGLVAVPLPDYVQYSNRISRYCHSMTFRQVYTSKDYYKYSFFPLTIVQWNSLPETVACLQNLEAFNAAVFKLQPQWGYSHFLWIHRRGPSFYPQPKKILRFADHPKKIPVLSGIPKKILELLAYPKKLHVFIFFMPIDEILSHPYDLSCWWDVKSQINQPTEHVTIQLVYVGTRK